MKFSKIKICEALAFSLGMYLGICGVGDTKINHNQETSIEYRIKNVMIYERDDKEYLQKLVRKKALENDIDPVLFHYLIKKESKYNPKVISKKRALGLGQLKLSTAQVYCPNITKKELLEKPEINVEIAAMHLKDLLKKYEGDVYLALAEYNGGYKALKQSTDCNGKKIFECEINEGYRQTRNYIFEILNNYKENPDKI